MKTKRIRILLVLIVLIAALVAAGFYYKTWSKYSQELTLSGNVDIRQVNLAFRVAGRVQQVLVDEGTPIDEKGVLLAIIDPQPLQNTLNEARANLAAAQAQYDLMVAGYRKEEVAQALALLQARQAQLVNAKKMLARQESLAGTGAVPSNVLDDARSAYDSAVAQVEAARQNYESLRIGYRPEQIEQARAQVDLAQARVDAAQLQLDDAKLTAPASGIIITRAIEPGSMVAAGTPAFTLSLNDPVWIRAYVEEPYLGQVGVGTKVDIFTDTPGGNVYQGVVGFVSPTAEFTPKQVQTQDLRTGLVYRLRVIVQNPDSGIRQGMPVTIKLAQE